MPQANLWPVSLLLLTKDKGYPLHMVFVPLPGPFGRSTSCLATMGLFGCLVPRWQHPHGAALLNGSYKNLGLEPIQDSFEQHINKIHQLSTLPYIREPAQFWN